MRKLLLLLTCLLMCCCSALALAADKTKAADDADAIKPVETISAAVMNERLQAGDSDDLLYVKIKEDRVEVYQGLAADRSLRKQLILTMPNTEMLRLYTNNKACLLYTSDAPMPTSTAIRLSPIRIRRKSWKTAVKSIACGS